MVDTNDCMTNILLLNYNYIVKHIAAGKVTVPISSRNITNCIEKQKVPQSSSTSINSRRLWIVELIHLRRCERRTMNVFGTTVLQ